jgi:hypothetical protein
VKCNPVVVEGNFRLAWDVTVVGGVDLTSFVVVWGVNVELCDVVKIDFISLKGTSPAASGFLAKIF